MSNQTPPLFPAPNPPAQSVPTKEPFAYQAAKFALGAPIAAIAIGCGVNASMQGNNSSPPSMSREVSLFIAGINLLLLLSSVVMGIIALAAIPRLGPKRLLARALGGILISVLFLGATAYLVFFMRGLAARTQQTITHKITGEWESISTLNGQNVRSHLSLLPDSTAQLTMTAASTVMVNGRWHVHFRSATLPSVLTFELDKPLDDPEHTSAFQWELTQVGDGQFSLTSTSSNGKSTTELYVRAR